MSTTPSSDHNHHRFRELRHPASKLTVDKLVRGSSAAAAGYYPYALALAASEPTSSYQVPSREVRKRA